MQKHPKSPIPAAISLQADCAQPESPLPLTLIQFDQLPNSANVRQPVVQMLFGISAATVWRRVLAGELPKPRKYGTRTTTWNVGELREALEAAAQK